jgi:hypothetical protein
MENNEFTPRFKELLNSLRQAYRNENEDKIKLYRSELKEINRIRLKRDLKERGLTNQQIENFFRPIGGKRHTKKRVHHKKRKTHRRRH